MSIKEFVNTTNKIIECAVIGNYWGKSGLSVQSFGLGENAINFINENKISYRNFIAELFCQDRDIQNTYTLKKFETEFIGFFSEKIITKSNISIDCATKFLEQIKSIDVHEFSILRDIYGIKLNNPDKCLSLGDYNIYSFNTYKNSIPDNSEKIINNIFIGNKPDYLIEFKAKARHHEKAVEIADKYFERFEYLIKFTMGNRSPRYEVGVLSYLGWRHRRAYAITPDGMGSFSSSNHGAIEKLPIDDPYFNDQEAGYDYLWKIATLNDANKFQKRILLAVEWIGQSIAESQLPSAFIKSAIALEIIFTHSEKTLITPSILNQISEGAAIILGDNLESRLEVEKSIKALYSKRSAIVHSGNKDINESDCQNMLAHARAVIIALLSNINNREINSIEMLYDKIKISKYSGNKI